MDRDSALLIADLMLSEESKEQEIIPEEPPADAD